MSELLSANNPRGYVDKYGSNHEWSMHGEWVEHRVDGAIHSTQHLQGFLDYQVPELYSKASHADITQLVVWMSANEAPENKVLLVHGGTAEKRNGVWYTGMEEPLFQRPIQWEVKSYAELPRPPKDA